MRKLALACLLLFACADHPAHSGGGDLGPLSMSHDAAPAAGADLSPGAFGDLAGVDLAAAARDLGKPATSGSASGAITGSPMHVSVPLSGDALDLLTVYLSDDQGQTWYANYQDCSGGISFAASDGNVDVVNDYCTSAATRYQIVTRPAGKRFGPLMTQFPVTLNDAVFSVSALPSLAVYFSHDHRATWTAQYETCAGGESFLVSDGKLTLQSTYCTAGATDFQVVTRPGSRRLSGQIASWPVVLKDASLTVGALPNLSVYWSMDHGTTWQSDYEICAGGRTFLITEGTLTLQSNYCTGSATDYVVVIDDA